MNRLLQSVHALLRSFRLWVSVGGLAITALTILVLLGHVPMPAVQTFDRLNQDHRLRWQPPEFEPRVLIVDIDEKSLQEQVESQASGAPSKVPGQKKSGTSSGKSEVR